MPNETFFSARWGVVFLAVMGALNVAMAVLMIAIGAYRLLPIFALGALLLIGLSIVEARVPQIEVRDDALVIRTARLRKPFRLPRLSDRPYRIVDTTLLGIHLARADGRAVSMDDAPPGLLLLNRTRLLVPTSSLSRAERARLREVLERWVAL